MSAALKVGEALLWPPPQTIEYGAGYAELPEDGVILIAAEDYQSLLGAAREVQRALQGATGGAWPLVAGGFGVSSDFAVALNQVPGSSAHPEGYTIRVAAGRFDAVASTARGLAYAAQTLCQLARNWGAHWRECRIVDWPDFPNRGVMLDVSRGRVPTMETLYGLVDRLAALKYNQLQLYTEHTFAYRQHREVWADASPLTGEEILALDVYCRERFIELVPNQNTFGHMRPWLTRERYRDLAEAPHGCNTRWGWFAEPFSLNPGDPRSLELVSSLLDELLPHFSSRQVNVGCDETVDLGEGRSRETVAARGFGAVFLDYLLKVHAEVQRRGRTMQFWGDIIMEYPELTDLLPRDAVALEWGYEANHPFDEHGARFAASGVPFYVCPGTSSWNSIAGRTENALANLENAARNGLRHGAVGYLVTDWGDNGHWQPHAVSLLPFFQGAAWAWSGARTQGSDVVAAADLLLFECTRGSLARVAHDLGVVDLLLGMPIHNTAALFQVLQSTPAAIASRFAEVDGGAPVRERLLQAVQRLDSIRRELAACQSDARDGHLLIPEFAWAAAMLAHACQRGLWVLDGAQPADAARLAVDAERLIAEYGGLWHARCRPGGYTGSVKLLDALHDSYQSDGSA